MLIKYPRKNKRDRVESDRAEFLQLAGLSILADMHTRFQHYLLSLPTAAERAYAEAYEFWLYSDDVRIGCRMRSVPAPRRPREVSAAAAKSIRHDILNLTTQTDVARLMRDVDELLARSVKRMKKNR